MTEVSLHTFALARSGDKGNSANVALFAPNAMLYEAVRREVTAERVRTHFGRFVRGDVERFDAPNVLAVNFVLHDSLDGGASRSLRSDPLGKAFGSLILRMSVELTDDEIAATTEPPTSRRS